MRLFYKREISLEVVRGRMRAYEGVHELLGCCIC